MDLLKCSEQEKIKWMTQVAQTIFSYTLKDDGNFYFQHSKTKSKHISPKQREVIVDYSIELLTKFDNLDQAYQYLNQYENNNLEDNITSYAR